MNAAPTPRDLRPRRALHLRALRALHGFLLRLLTAWSRRIYRVEIRRGSPQAEPFEPGVTRIIGDGVASFDAEEEFRCRVEVTAPGVLEYMLYLHRDV